MSSEKTRRHVLLGIGAASTVALAGCAGGGEETPTGTEEGTETSTEGGMETETETGMDSMSTGMVRAAHMSPDAPNVDIYVDGDPVLEDVAFGTVSGYLDAPAGDREVEITAAGDPDTSVFAGTVPVSADTAYTLAAVGEITEGADESFEILVLEDDNSAPESGNARVRLVHASPDAPAVDVTLESNGSAVYDGAAYGDAVYASVPAGDYTLQVRPDTETNDGDVAASFDVSVADGEVYTAFAAGYLTPDDDPSDTGFDLVVAQDTGGM